MTSDPARVVFYGLGPVGRAIAGEVRRRGALAIAGAIDRDPAKAGRDLGEVLGGEPMGVEVRADSAALLAAARPDLVLLSTTSSLELVRPQVLEILAAGARVVSTCEELSYPWAIHPELAAEIDAAARAAGASVLSTGVNPGFVMDYLPAVICGACRQVERIEVERRMDAAPRRSAFRDKIGAGATVAEFERRAAAGTLRHVGLAQSVHLIAHAAGWPAPRVEESLVPVVAAERIETPTATVEKGRVAGVLQIARGWVGASERITLAFRSTIGQPAPRDRLLIEATPRIDLSIEGGVQGDLATCNLVVNAIPAVLAAPPGLLTMLDLPPLATG